MSKQAQRGSVSYVDEQGSNLMLKKMFGVVVFGLAGSVFAVDVAASSLESATQAALIHNDLVSIQESLKQLKIQDNKSFCYVDGKAYSEGAVVEGKVCTRKAQLRVVDGEALPLIWSSPKKN